MPDYVKVGFKAGLEIHQQLDCGKLFCSCPGYLRNDSPHFTINRKLHSIAGEGGRVDAAVAHEAAIGRTFYYEGYTDTTCLVELDEAPPSLINQAALEESLKIALLLNCEIYQNPQVMRKTVIDGSNTGGFQRTVLIGKNGWVETTFGKITIESVALEEDSARTVEKSESRATYRLDRLGIPLVEIGTAPELKTAEAVKETALKLGEILRACKVKRGIGTIRQDVNISVKGHERVEVKGFQDPKMMIQTIDQEIERQIDAVQHGESTGSVRNALEDGSTAFLRPIPGKARMYPETDLPLLYISLDLINEIKKRLPLLRTQLRDELKKKGLHDELITLVLENGFEEFSVLSMLYENDPGLVAKMITLWRTEFATKLGVPLDKIKEVLSEALLEKVLIALGENKITPDDVKGILFKLAKGTPFDEAMTLEKTNDDELEGGIRAIIREKPGLRPNAYMGMVIQHFKGKIDARKAMELINKVIDS